MTSLTVTLGGLLAITAIVWWFWLAPPKATRIQSGNIVDIRVEGGTYQPATLAVAAHVPLTLRFTRLDATPCAEQVVFAALGLSASLPLGRPHDIPLPPLPPGTYEFTCQMGMYRGKLIAR